MKIGFVFSIALLISLSVYAGDSYDFVVAADGSGTHITVQAAFMAVPDFRKVETKILVKKGTYKEKLILPATKTNVTLVGEDLMKSVITHDDYASKQNAFGEEMGTTGSTSFYVYGDGFKAVNLTFENSSGPVGQAVAVRVDGDRVQFRGCRFLGFQDTLYPHGRGSRQYYYDCYIEGTTDFIFGWSTAVFEKCEVFSKKGGQYITAASTEESEEYGLIFMDCKLTGDAPKGSVYLGRPWRNFAKTVFINCEMGGHIREEGWHNWGKPEAEATAYYAEYGSTGKGSSDARVSWAKSLTKEQLEDYSLDKIFKGWNPNGENE